MIRQDFKKIAITLAVALAAPTVIPPTNVAIVAQAATPKLNIAKKTMKIGKSYTLKVKNTSSSYTYKWSSSKKAVATVTKKGVVKAKSEGTTTIKCNVLQDGKNIKTLTSKITVIGEAESIEITNAVVTEGYHTIELDSEYEFSAVTSPELNSSMVYWKSSNPAVVEVDEDGLCVALSPGTATITATAALNEEEVDSSSVSTSIEVKVEGEEENTTKEGATVSEVSMVGGSEIKIVFSEAVAESSVLDSSKGLTNNVKIASAKDSAGKYSTSPGKLTGSLSTDGKTLSIYSSAIFKGDYKITVSGVTTTSGTPFSTYSQTTSLIDTKAPSFVSATVDDSGLIATLTFDEELDVTYTRDSNGKVVGKSISIIDVSATSSSSTTLMSYLRNINNYSLSEDKKSIILDLTNDTVNGYIPTEDRKSNTFTVRFSGIADTSGNKAANLITECQFSLDPSYKANASVVSVERIAYNKIEVTYSRAIKQAGTMTIGSTPAISPNISDSSFQYRTDKRKVVYTLTDAAMNYMGDQTVRLYAWSAYNINPAENISNANYTTTMRFRDENNKPTLTGCSVEKIDKGNNLYVYQIKATYSRPVDLPAFSNKSGVNSASFANVKYTRSSNNTIGFTSLSYSASVDGQTITYNISGSQIDNYGVYEITVPSGTVVDLNNTYAAEHKLVVTLN